MNIAKIKAPETLNYKDEYIFNNGYHFANCEWPDKLNHLCFYLDYGCTDCRNDVILLKYARIFAGINWLKYIKEVNYAITRDN